VEYKTIGVIRGQAFKKMKRIAETTQLNVDIPTQLHREIKAAAALDGVTLAEWVAAALKARKQYPSHEPSGIELNDRPNSDKSRAQKLGESEVGKKLATIKSHPPK
jgi:hypothetical protein